MTETLTMTGAQHEALKAHLFPDDGKEAVALLLCGRRRGPRHRLLVHEVVLVPLTDCVRCEDRITWPTSAAEPMLARATNEGFAIVKIHSHPSGYGDFSAIDDISDREFFESVYCWVGTDEPHGSAVMLPDGTVFGRTVKEDGTFEPWPFVTVAGDTIRLFPGDQNDKVAEMPAYAAATVQAFGKRTFATLAKMKVAVIGCSGTGSVVIELLARNGVGELILVDPDRIEDRNLNRIVNSTAKDVGEYKVEVLRAAVDKMELGTRVTPIAMNLIDPEVVKAVADADVVVGCMDGAEGRHVLNRIAAYYLLPYFDVGVHIDVEQDGTILGVEAAANYVKPGGASLMSRGLYTLEQVRAESIKRTDPVEYARQRKLGYIPLVGEGRPAVISINMLAAAMGINEFIARVNPYRDVENVTCERHVFSLYLGHLDSEGFTEPCKLFARVVGRGDVQPLLDMPALSEVAS